MLGDFFSVFKMTEAQDQSICLCSYNHGHHGQQGPPLSPADAWSLLDTPRTAGRVQLRDVRNLPILQIDRFSSFSVAVILVFW